MSNDYDTKDTIRGLRAALRQMAAMRDHIAAERDEARRDRDSAQAEVERLTHIERHRSFWAEVSTDPRSGWCGEHPRRVEAGTAGMVGLDTKDGDDLCLACELLAAWAERDAAAAHARHMQQALDNTFKDRDAAHGDADRLRRTLAVVLARFTEPGHIGAAGDCLRTGWVQAELVNEWRELVEVSRG